MFWIASVARVAKLDGKVCLHLVILIKITGKVITFCCRCRGIFQFPIHPLSRMNRWPVLALYESKPWGFKLLLLKLLLAFCQIQVSWGFNFVVRRRIEERIMISCQALGWLLLLGMLRKVSVELEQLFALPYGDAWRSCPAYSSDVRSYWKFWSFKRSSRSKSKEVILCHWFQLSWPIM